MNSQEWWLATKADPEKLIDWLKKQYHGEATAAVKMRGFLASFGKEAKDPSFITVVESIAAQEEDHARWVGELLEARGIKPEVIEGRHERYWEQALPGIDSWETGCAVAAHAEKMRLDRISVIAADETAPDDIRKVFQKILPDEIWHEESFRVFSTPEAMAKTFPNHKAGAAALGLVS